MEIKEAIKHIQGAYSLLLQSHVRAEDLIDYKEASGIAINAMQKQIPKKPTYDGDGYAPDGSFVWDEWICPGCGTRYEVDFDDYSYCPNCGQATDLSEEYE